MSFTLEANSFTSSSFNWPVNSDRNVFSLTGRAFSTALQKVFVTPAFIRRILLAH